MADAPPPRSPEYAEVVRLPGDPFLFRVKASRRRAPRLWRELEMLPYAHQEAALFSDPRYRTWGLAELLAQRSIQAASRDPQAALNLAYLASNVPFGMRENPPSWISEARIEQLLAYTVAHVANGLRVVGFLPRADHMFKRAFDCWSFGTGEPDTLGYRARILDLQASLLRAQRRVPEALAVLDEVVGYYLKRDPHLAGRAMVSTSKALQEIAAYSEGLDSLRQAQYVIEPGRDRDLERALLHNLLLCQASSGHYGEARARLPELRRLYRDDPRSLDALRVDWIEARILEGEGNAAGARLLLEKVRLAFRQRAYDYELAIVTLELAVLAAKEGDAGEVQRLARETLPILCSQEIHREAAVALVLFQDAAFTRRKRMAAVARAVLRYLKRSWGQPDLPFHAVQPH